MVVSIESAATGSIRIEAAPPLLLVGLPEWDSGRSFIVAGFPFYRVVGVGLVPDFVPMTVWEPLEK